MQCPAKGGWLLRLESGSATVAVAKTATASQALRRTDGRRDDHGWRRSTLARPDREGQDDRARLFRQGARGQRTPQARADEDVPLAASPRSATASMSGSSTRERLPEAPAVAREERGGSVPAKMTRSGSSSLTATANPGGSPRPASRHVRPASCGDEQRRPAARRPRRRSSPRRAAATTRGSPVSAAPASTSSLDGTSSPSRDPARILRPPSARARSSRDPPPLAPREERRETERDGEARQRRAAMSRGLTWPTSPSTRPGPAARATGRAAKPTIQASDLLGPERGAAKKSRLGVAPARRPASRRAARRTAGRRRAEQEEERLRSRRGR